MKKVKLGEVCEILNGFAFKSSLYVNEGIRIIRITNVQKGYIEDSDPKYYPIEYTNSIEKYILKENDLLMSLTGNVGRVGLISKTMLPAALNQRVACLRTIDSLISKEYVFQFLNSDLFEQSAIRSSNGVAQKNLSTDWLKKVEITYPSVEQQELITSTLNLIERLICCRKKQNKKFNELVKSRFNEMFILSDFSLKRLGELVDEVRYGTSLPATINGKYGYLRMNNITENGKLNIQNLKHIDIPEKDLEKYVVRKGDVLFNRTNSIELVGKTCIYELDFDMVIAGYIIRIRTNNNILNPRYLSEFLNFPSTKKFLRNIAKGAVNQANINAKELQDISIPLAPLSLQNEFADFVAQVDKSQLAIQKSLEELETLKKSLMQEYFG